MQKDKPNYSAAIFCCMIFIGVPFTILLIIYGIDHWVAAELCFLSNVTAASLPPRSVLIGPHRAPNTCLDASPVKVQYVHAETSNNQSVQLCADHFDVVCCQSAYSRSSTDLLNCYKEIAYQAGVNCQPFSGSESVQVGQLVRCKLETSDSASLVNPPHKGVFEALLVFSILGLICSFGILWVMSPYSN
jgi:hypothetical protein